MIFLYANPTQFMQISQRMWKFLAVLILFLIPIGAYYILTVPPDYQQGVTVRILFIHVPAAWMAMSVYAFMVAASISAFIWRTPLADIAAQQSALVGTAWVFIALLSGSLWGKPMWGHFWAWDARLVSVLILFFLYLGYIALIKAIDDRRRANYAARLLVIIGAVNLPIIKFSVDWWNTLHQPASVFTMQGPKMDSVFLLPLGVMAFFAICFTACLILIRMRTEIMRRQIENILSGKK